MFKKNSAGMVALLPAIILSGILLIMMVTASRSFLSLIWRTNMADEKTQSTIIAKACIRRSLASFLENNDYRGGETISIGEYSCMIKPFSVSEAAVNIEVLVKIDEVKSTDTVLYDSNTQGILSELIL